MQSVLPLGLALGMEKIVRAWQALRLLGIVGTHLLFLSLLLLSEGFPWPADISVDSAGCGSYLTELIQQIRDHDIGSGYTNYSRPLDYAGIQ